MTSSWQIILVTLNMFSCSYGFVPAKLEQACNGFGTDHYKINFG